ncbi:MAG: NADH-quinone oxidoreductase subunit A [Clostridiales bacterium]|nr:NADH-quinone oxidoreductase subunit A [Clostridiales bacterium]
MSFYVDLVIFALVGFLLPIAAVLVGKLLRRDYPDPLKEVSYESGIQPFGEARVKYHIHYYVFALIFLVFDVEALFLFPWAIAYRQIVPWVALVEALVFIAILVVGLIYAWKKKVLTWI